MQLEDRELPLILPVLLELAPRLAGLRRRWRFADEASGELHALVGRLEERAWTS
jgi:hypothetical protein